MKVRRFGLRAHLIPVLSLVAGSAFAGDDSVSAWIRQDVDWRASGGGRIRGVFFPPDKPTPMRFQEKSGGQSKPRRRLLSPQASTRSLAIPSRQAAAQQQSGAPSAISVLIVDSPPIDGFVPYIAVSATTEKNNLDEIAEPSSTVGPMFAGRQADFAIGLYDTGAGTHVMGRDVATTLGATGSNLTTYQVEINGVTGSVFAFISKPMGLYADGLAAIDGVSGALNNTNMMGETNVSIAVGSIPPPGQPDLPTALGSPLAVYYAALFHNDQPITRVVAGQSYTAPDISLHDPLDPSLPEYLSYVPLELRPLGSANVQYVPCTEIFPGTGCVIQPTPSIIVGNSAQSLFFLGSVDLYDGPYFALDRTRFMLDTGAQVTVIGKRTAARLSLNLTHPEFQVEIQGVDGQSVMEPGFYLDRIDIPALGEWLSFTRVPVVVLDVASPEGGTLDGIIGMNLLMKYNFLVRGGGLSGQGYDPSLECQVIAPLAVNVDFDGDGDVDQDDFGHFQACYTGPLKPQKAAACVNARLDADSDVDESDLAIFTPCISSPGVPASVDCVSP